MVGQPGDPAVLADIKRDAEAEGDDSDDDPSSGVDPAEHSAAQDGLVQANVALITCHPRSFRKVWLSSGSTPSTALQALAVSVGDHMGHRQHNRVCVWL